MRIKATFVSAGVDVPNDAKVGDVLRLSGKARIVGIEDEVVDATLYGGEPEYVPGERTVSLLITARLRRLSPEGNES